MIHFTEDELHWQCGSSSWCECSATDNLPHRKSKGTLNALSTKYDWHINWQRLVQEYTSLQLSFPTDIFPAIQGLAKKCPGVLGKYYAGLWEHTIIYGLTWHLFWNDSKRPRPQKWRAPTWSWASVYGEIRFSLCRCKPGQYSYTFATIVSVVTIPVGEDAMGELSDAWLIIRGLCVVGTLQENPVYQEFPTHTITIPHDVIQSSSSGPICIGLTQDSVAEHGGRTVYLDYPIEEPGRYHVPDGSEVLIMKIDETCDPQEDFKVRGWLILRRVDQVKKIYERIGVIKMKASDDDSGLMEKWYEHSAKEMEVTVI
jgi:hypothetical protein